MGNSSILFKISGDLIYDEEILKEVKESIKEYSKVGVVYGFGTILSQKLKERGRAFSYINGSRKTTKEGLEIAWEISEEIKKFLSVPLKGAILISPVTKLNGEIININADELVFKNSDSYDKKIIYTLKGRNKEVFKTLDNVEIRER